MGTIYDLTRTIEHTMPVYPQDDPVQLSQVKTLRRDGYNNFRLQTGMHAGTHIDGLMHLTESPEFLVQIPLNRFIGTGKIIDVEGCKSPIVYKTEYGASIMEGDIVLVHTGHDRFFGSEKYYGDYPVFDEQWAHILIDKKVKMAGFDSPSPDIDPYKIHTLLLNNRILIMENLANLAQLLTVTRFEIIALPLRIRADSSPARVIARSQD